MLQAERSITIRTKPFIAGQETMSFELVDELKNGADGSRIWKAIQVFGETELAVFEGFTLVDDADLDQATIRLTTQDGILHIQDLPLTALLRAQNGGYYYELKDLNIDLAQCEITLQSNTGYAANEVICFEIIYQIVDPINIYLS